MTTNAVWNPPHRWVADKIGLTISGVSLIRNGKRFPSYSTMEAINKAIGWGVANQVMKKSSYPEVFNQKMFSAFRKEQTK